MSNRIGSAVVVVMLVVAVFTYLRFKDLRQPDAANDEKRPPVIGGSEKPGGPSAKTLFDGWEKPAVAIVFSGEQHGYVEPCGCSLHQLGGLSRRSDLLRQIGERGWPATAFDVGGLVNNPTRQQAKFKFEMILKCLTDMRYAGVAMGVEELRLG